MSDKGLRNLLSCCGNIRSDSDSVIEYSYVTVCFLQVSANAETLAPSAVDAAAGLAPLGRNVIGHAPGEGANCKLQMPGRSASACLHLAALLVKLKRGERVVAHADEAMRLDVSRGVCEQKYPVYACHST